MAVQGDRRSVERRQSERRAHGELNFRGLAQFGQIAGGGAEIIGYRIEAPDGQIGRAVDFCVEEEGSVVTGLLAAPRRIFPTRKRIFVPLSAIERIDERAKKIYVTPCREDLMRGSRTKPRTEASG